MKDSALELARAITGSARDLAPILLVVLFFQLAVLRQPLPNLVETGVGILMVLLGLTFFLRGLEQGLFPLGESIATAFARKGSLFWLLAFAFALGFGTTVAEPALIAVAAEAATAAARSEVIEGTPEAMAGYALGLRLTVGLSVGIAIVIGVFRILKGWRIEVMLIRPSGPGSRRSSSNRSGSSRSTVLSPSSPLVAVTTLKPSRSRLYWMASRMSGSSSRSSLILSADHQRR